MELNTVSLIANLVVADRYLADYHINKFYSPADQCYVADIPDLKACSSFGDSPEVAMREVLIAKTAWLDVARQKKRTVPKPTYRPVIYQTTEFILN